MVRIHPGSLVLNEQVRCCAGLLTTRYRIALLMSISEPQRYNPPTVSGDFSFPRLLGAFNIPIFPDLSQMPSLVSYAEYQELTSPFKWTGL